MSHDRTVIRHVVEEIGFGFFKEDEIKRLSVKRITSPVTFDTLNNPLPGGLYDPVLGTTEKVMICETCGQDSKNCPGHMGHIELAVPVYNPLLFGPLLKLMRAKCFNCHNLQLSKNKTRVAAVKMMLIDAGRGQEALELDKGLLGYLKEDGNRSRNVLDENHADTMVSAVKYRERVLSALEAELAENPRSEWNGGHLRMLRRQVMDEFMAAIGAMKRCENCGAYSPRIQKDGFDKLFQMPLAEKFRIMNHSSKADIKSAVQGYDLGKTVEGNDSEPMSEDDESEDNFDDGSASGRVTLSGVAPGSSLTGTAPAKQKKFMPPIEVELQMQLLWKNEYKVLDLVFAAGRSNASSVNGDANRAGLNVGTQNVGGGYRLFFRRVIAVPPPRFRPPMDMGGMVVEHPQNVLLTKILTVNEKLKNTQSLQEDLASVLTTWIELQNRVNCYIDSSKDQKQGKEAMPGLRQVLEKKEGIFRKHMMGKRVNYACRSVISPDPYIGTTEIGIPLRFAKELTYPQPVADWNVEIMRELVENGADTYPGANFVEGPSGRLIHLDRLSELRRRGIAARLLSFPGQKVWRHLQDGDCMLVNRQPTLHKPGIMAHRVRVLRNPSYQTIRMHYANCNTYNADFDGDEINCHLPQNEVAKAEANLLAFTDEQYLVPTNGQPLRGLIQDHVDAGVKICSKDCFFTRGEYQQLVYQALSGLPGLEIVPPSDRIQTLSPAILKPVKRWTGKQVISTILKHLTEGLPQLNLTSKTKTPAVAFGVVEMEHEVIFRQGELLQGVLDKAAFGSTQYGLVHAVHELYGGTAAGKLLTGLGRVLTIFLQWSGHTCGVEDLTLTAEAENVRRGIIHKAEGVGQRSMREILAVQDGVEAASRSRSDLDAKGAGADGVVDEDAPLGEKEVESIRQRTAAYLVGAGRDDRLADIDRHMQSALAPVSSEIIKACLPGGQEKPFPSNSFSLMVLTGGKGSMVNHSQVSCALGQQTLEGRRVPVMVSGKSLPSFRAFEPSPRANGFITDRFLTGIKPQVMPGPTCYLRLRVYLNSKEYYFHCMAGREGLVDTAVKTSRSGYLQRCLVKHLEELKVGYDNTVRDGEGCVQQFLYGEDGVDTTQTKYLAANQFDFLAQNYRALRHKHGITSSVHSYADFESRSAQLAHSMIAASKERARKASMSGREGPVFVPGVDVLARRRARGGGKGKETWGEAELMDGWHPAKVIKVRHAGTDQALYNVRYNDGAVGKKIPVAIGKSPLVDSDQDSQDEENGGEDLATEGRKRGSRGMRRLLRAECGVLPDPVLSTLSVNRNLGCVSEVFQTSLKEFLDSSPPSLQGNDGPDVSSAHSPSRQKGSGVRKDASPVSLKEAFERMMWVKYMRCLAAPGETVGSIAAQSIGEPSTQMTLNTFHLAGHGGANVTLGIPRLREIIMTAAKNLKTPSTVVPLREGVSRDEADNLSLRLSRLSLSMLLDNKDGVVVRERLIKGNAGAWERHYTVCLKLFATRLIRQAFGIEFKQICRTISSVFTSLLLNAITADLRKSGVRLAANSRRAPVFAHPSNMEQDNGEDDPAKEALNALEAGIKASKKADAEYESEEEDEEQGTFKFGRQKEQATYAMDDEEKALWKSLNGKDANDLMDDGGNSEEDEGGSVASDLGDVTGCDRNEKAGGSEKYFDLPTSVVNSRIFKGISKTKKKGEVEVTLKLPSNTRRLLMVGLAEAAAEKTMVRSQAGIRGAFVVETTSEGKSGLAVQLEGSRFETVWQLKEGIPGGLMEMNKLTSNDIWAMRQAYGVEAARASIVAEITGVFEAYGISVDPRHLGLVADHMTFDGGYRPMNRAGMADFSSPCLQMSFETTAVFLAKAAVAGQYDKLKSPSARIAIGRVGAFGTGMFDLRQPAEVDVGV